MTDVESPAYVPGHGLLNGRTAVITAAAGAGIGGATARRFLEEGARVLISDAHARRLKEYEAELAGRVRSGVRRRAAVRRHRRGPGAGAVRRGRRGCTDGSTSSSTTRASAGPRTLVDMTDEQWSKVLDVTLNGTFRCTRAALRLMRESGGGVIVNNASVVGWRAQAGQAHYAAAKAGVMALTRCAAVEAAEYGVRVNAVSPSLAMHPHLVKVTTPELLAELTAREAFGRYAEPWEVANVIVFLASGYSSYMTGEVVSVSSQHP